jgi:hypothetical protein
MARRLTLTLGAALVVALTLAAVAAVTGAPAGAQQDTVTTYVDNFGLNTDSRGIAGVSWPSDWTVYAACNGSYPLQGDATPAQVQNRRPAPNFTLFKIRNRLGVPVVGFVRVNCALTVVAPVPLSAAKIAQTLRSQPGVVS